MDFILGPFTWMTAALSLYGWYRSVSALRDKPFRTTTAVTDRTSDYRRDVLTGLIMISAAVLVVGAMIGRLQVMLLSANYTAVLVGGTIIAAGQLAVGVLDVVHAVAQRYAKLWIEYEERKLSS